MIDRVDLRSEDIAAQQMAKLKELFPEVFTEGGRVDFERLRLTLGDTVDVGKERFGLTWHGKGDCFRTIQTPSVATLTPAPEESINFDTSENLFIEGDNLEVLKLLQKSYLGKVKMIYIDPPYNTGNDFVYPDDFSQGLRNYMELTGQVDSEGRALMTNKDSNGRFHSDWLNMMYPRLFLAKNLLREDGVIFISIDDNEVHNLRALCNEIFGEENFLIQGIWISGRTASAHFTNAHEYVIGYAKNKSTLPLFGYDGDNSLISDRTIKKPGVKNPLSDISFPSGIDFECEDKIFPNRFGESEPIEVIEGVLQCKNGKLKEPVTLRAAWAMRDMIINWLDGEDVIDQKGQKVNRFFFKNNGVLQYEKVKGTIHPNSVISGITTKQGSKIISDLLEVKSLFDFPKPIGLVDYFAGITKADDIILDFFAGSGTTAHAVMQLNAEDSGSRKFICVQLPEPTDDKSEAAKAGYKTIAEISKERIRRAAAKIAKEETEKAAKKTASLFDSPDTELTAPLDLGFKVFKLAPSNFKIWDGGIDKSPEAIQKALFDHIDHIDERAAQEAILYELLLKSGFELTTPIEKLTIAGKTVFSIMDNALIICLEKELTLDLVREIAALSPVRVICLDEGFHNDDSLKTNAVQIMKSKRVEDFRTV